MFKDVKKFFVDFVNRFKSAKFKKLAPIIVIFCVLIILIPTFIAIWDVYFKNDDIFPDSKNITVTLCDAEGNIIATDTVSESNIGDSRLINIFYAMNAGIKTAAPSDTVKENYSFSLKSGNNSTQYVCHFSESAGQSYLSDTSGNFYSVNKTSYDEFLSSEYSEAAYSGSRAPTLVTGNNDVVIPASVSWHYKDHNGLSRTASENATSSVVSKYEINGSVSLSFQKAPDICRVTIADSNGNSVFEGNFDDLSSITADPDTELYVDIQAFWLQKTNPDSYGDIFYEFSLLCKDRAVFELNSSEVSPGEFVIITASKLEKGATVSFSPVNFKNRESENLSENLFESSDLPALIALKQSSPIFDFESYGNSTAFGILAIPFDTPSGDFEFAVSSGVSSQHFTLTITEAKDNSSVTLTKSKKLINQLISKDALFELNKLLAGVADKSTNVALFRNEFATFRNTDFEKKYSFGDRFISGETEIPDFHALGNDYAALINGGQTVRALNIGRVVYVGEAVHLGKFVVVDHGIGVCTWYCHLGDFDVSIGDILAKGDPVGKCGNGTMLYEKGVLLLCSIGKTFVSPDCILNKVVYSAK